MAAQGRVGARGPAGTVRRETQGRRRRVPPRGQAGLTLIELMIVVAIIAVIAAIAIAIYQDVTKKSKLAADYGTVASLRSAIAIYYGRTNGTFPTSMTEVNSLITPAPVYQCAATPTYIPANGKINFTATIGDCP
ncbi:MAG TPA: prepilin-type N-terminal cleavage/methylation domain-containing protein [Methylomirabilota bacterium]|jgi:prepilin-type N-terminal cleavage/methylation domain-containing protein|nr:prepilin-type N-terminal cleavage/methylation domain-containing protein [Methylomirabilota bacterium]